MNFEFKQIEAVRGEIRFYALKKIKLSEKSEDSKDIVSQFEEHIRKKHANFTTQLDRILTIMTNHSCGHFLPPTQHKLFTSNEGGTIQEHEFKTKNLRYYGVFLKEKGMFIIYASVKEPKKQKRKKDGDVAKFRELKDQVVAQILNDKD